MTIRLDGQVTEGTKGNLIEGIRSSPMPAAAVDAVFSQTSNIAANLIEIYEKDVAAGEVGSQSSGTATEAPILAASPPRALIYGRVQSGKTVSMILTAALCLDNGFRVVVVLTTDNVALVKQTAGRFKDLSGPRVFAGVKDDGAYGWEGQIEDLKKAIPKDGLVIVCAKNSVNLPEVIRFLSDVNASVYPVLVLDDEADAATPDTTVAARATGRANAPKQPSKMYRLVITNDDPGELGFSLGQILPHSLYVQVTATPYVLFLQREGEQLRPSGTFLLEPGTGYTGGEAYFGAFDPAKLEAAPSPPIVLVDSNEGATIRNEAPAGLMKSIDFFVLSACSLSIRKNGWPVEGFKHLSHTSHTTTEHKIVSEYITTHLNNIRDYLFDNGGNAETYFADAYAELQQTVADAPPLPDLLTICRKGIQNVEVCRINSKVKPPTYGPRLNFLIGGNILGRGLTIGDLLVTYYIREAKVSQMDTVWQHARMFGYRQSYLDHTRVYLPRQLATRFSELHQGEELLRRAVNGGDPETVLIRLPGSSRATRPNALDPNAIRGIAAGRRQVNPERWAVDQKAASGVLGILQSAGVSLPEAANREDRGSFVSLSQCIQLVKAVATPKDDIWDSDVIAALFTSFEAAEKDGVFVYVRKLDPQAADARTRGRLAGQEIDAIRAKSPKVPALALLYIRDFSSPEAWFPTVVMPANSPGFVFSGE